MVIVRRLRLSCCLSYSHHELRQSAVEKTVMFQEETISANADFAKDRKSMYKYHKLSAEEKKKLYLDRPDLNPKQSLNNSSPNNCVSSHGIMKDNPQHDITQPLLAETNRDCGSKDNTNRIIPSAAESVEYTTEDAHLKLLCITQQERTSVSFVDDNKSDSSSGDEADEEDLELNLSE